MASELASRAAENPNLTLANALTAVRAANLPERRRQEISSALRTIARAIGKPPERIPSHPRLLAARLKQIAPTAIGISRGRWNNIRSLARAGVALVQPMSPGRNRNRVTPGWQALFEQLELRTTKIAVSRFLRFCSARGIEPEEVSQTTFKEFRDHLDDTLMKRPDEVFSATVRGWRTAQTAVEAWPRIAVSVADRRRIWTLPWTAFPASLHQDVNGWLDRLAGRDLLDDVPIRPVRSSTIAHRERQIRAFASALVRRGRNPNTITCLQDLVEKEAFKEGLRFFLERHGGKSTSAIADMATALKAIAKHYLRRDSRQLDVMGAIISRLACGRRGLTETNRARLRPLDDPSNAAALLRLPPKLMSIAARNRHPRLGAIEAQIAVAIEILLMAPLRIGNLVNIDLERNLVHPGRGKALHLIIEREEVKNREPLEYPLPPQSVELIDRYIREFRPRIASSTVSTALFPGEGGKPKSRHTLGKQIADTIHAHTGMINVHARGGVFEPIRSVGLRWS